MTYWEMLHYTSEGEIFTIAAYLSCEIGFDNLVFFTIVRLWPSANELDMRVLSSTRSRGTEQGAL